MKVCARRTEEGVAVKERTWIIDFDEDEDDVDDESKEFGIIIEIGEGVKGVSETETVGVNEFE